MNKLQQVRGLSSCLPQSPHCPTLKSSIREENAKSAGGTKACTKTAENYVGRVGHVGHLLDIHRKACKKCTPEGGLCVGHVGHVGQIES